MYTVRQGGKVDYNYKEVFCDTQEDLDSLDLNSSEFRNMCTGSIAYVIATGTVYILNSQRQWVAQ